jgi:hypothetical protein
MKKTISILDNIRWSMLVPTVFFLVLYTYTPDKNWIAHHGFELAFGCLFICGVLSIIVERLQQKLKSIEKRE